jgi:lantibiotic modifying enzyme
MNGLDAKRARNASREISEVLLNWPTSDPSLAGGAAGIALFLAYQQKVEPDAERHRRIQALLERAVEEVATTAMTPSFFAGFSGVAWVVEHLLQSDVDLNQQIDSVMLELVSRSPWLHDYDLVNGLVGFGVYALERLPRPTAVRLLEQVTVRLEELAKTVTSVWKTAPELIPESKRSSWPDGHYNLGIAHGIPGAIALLAETHAAGLLKERIAALLRGAIGWLLRQKRSDGDSSFASALADERPAQTARSAWCYGDPGIAVTLFAAARALKDSNVEAEAIAIGERAAQRPFQSAGVIDSALCHGSAGLGHIFNRLFQATGVEAFRQEARSWFERTLDWRSPGNGISGFQSWTGETWVADPGLLNGAAGIGLALLAATTAIEPTWDRLLLCRIPPAG